MRQLTTHLALVGLALAGCHLIGGADDLNIVRGKGSATSGSSPGAGGNPTAGPSTTTMPQTAGGMGGQGGTPLTCEETCVANSECVTCMCVGDLCDCTDLETGMPCMNDSGYCLSGDCYACLDNSTYPCPAGPMTCQSFECVELLCTNMMFDMNSETDLDCGIDCAPCVNGKMCGSDSDCVSARCVGSTCAMCNDHGQCGGGRFCNTSGNCRNLKGGGDVCDYNYECGSGACLGGVICA